MSKFESDIDSQLSFLAELLELLPVVVEVAVDVHLQHTENAELLH